MHIHRKLVIWIKRYLPGELIGTAIALTSASVTYNISHSYVAAGIAGTIGENIGYYGYFLSKEAFLQYKKHSKHKPIRRVVLVSVDTTKQALVEFGPAEVVDSLLIRPYLMTVGPQYIGPYWLGTLVSKIMADAIFYSLAILGYERKALQTKAKTVAVYAKERVITLFPRV